MDAVHAVFPDLRDASVFVTGGGSGIGAALTEGFLRQGARVAFCQRRDGSAFADEMDAATDNRPLFLHCDITDVGALRGTMAEAARVHGPVTRLILNAANDDRHATLDVTEEYWDRNQAVNLRSYFFAAQAAIPGMREAGGGAIVAFSSISYMMGNAGYPSYTAANAGITALARSLAREFGPDGIRVNALAPGWVLTDKQREMWVTEQGLADHLKRQCLPRPLGPADIVAPCLFLASDASAAMTGQAMAVDGGVVVSG